MHDTLTNKSHVQYEAYTDLQRSELNSTIRKYLNEEIDDIEVINKHHPQPHLPFFSHNEFCEQVINLRQIKEMLLQFRLIYRDLEREIEGKFKNKLSLYAFIFIYHRMIEVTLCSDKLPEENGDQIHLVVDDEGVGEIEGGGFAVGLAPSSKNGVCLLLHTKYLHGNL